MNAIDVTELKRLLDEGAANELWDVRTDAERRLARIEPSRLLDQEGVDYIQDLPRDAPLYFYCHHGIRSRAAAHHFAAMGFTNVTNITGGIDAWSELVDPAVPRY